MTASYTARRFKGYKVYLITHSAHTRLERHIRTEERQLFVLAEKRMKPTEIAELGRQIKAHLR
jgi:hypothetical protein